MSNSEKKIGMLALSKGSNLYYLKRLQVLYKRKYQTEQDCVIEVIDTDFETINNNLPDQFDNLSPILSKYFEEANQRGISQLLLPNFTLHQAVDHLDIKSPIQIEVAHALNLCLQYIDTHDIQKASIFGSAYTMESPYIMNPLLERGIEILPKSESENKSIDQFRKTVYAQKERPDLIDQYQTLVKTYARISVVLIACSELSMYCPYELDNVVDIADLQIDYLI